MLEFLNEIFPNEKIANGKAEILLKEVKRIFSWENWS